MRYKTDGTPIKAWVRNVPIDDSALQQLKNVATLPFIHRWVAAMPDAHWGVGATVGSVIPTRRAIIPAAVGVDIGCGMMATQTTLTASELPDNLKAVRTIIEQAVPHGQGGRGSFSKIPMESEKSWHTLRPDYEQIVARHASLGRGRSYQQIGTLGGGNHFIEICLDQGERVWIMLHSGSRGVGSRIGQHFIDLARRDMKHHIRNLPDRDLAYFEEGAEHFDDYLFAVEWAQKFARANRDVMMQRILGALQASTELPGFQTTELAVNCHHNYVQREHHYGEDVFVTRKGALRAGAGELGIIPGSMGARSFIVRGLGNPESFESCSHGAGRAMSRTQARQRISVKQHAEATAHVECRKDAGVIDESPAAYKDIDKVMAAQSDLVDILHTLRQVVCVKG